MMNNEKLRYPFGMIPIIFLRKYHNYSIFILHYSSFIRACCSLQQALFVYRKMYFRTKSSASTYIRGLTVLPLPAATFSRT
mgnify:FL=1